MRIKFCISTYDPNRWGEDCVGSDPAGHNSYTTQRHHHELYSFKEMFREEFRQYCVDSYHLETKTTLIDIPDDIGFQFMMEGIMDGDYLVYNLYTENYVFGSSLSSAETATYDDGSKSQGVSWGGSVKSAQMIEWGVNNNPTNTRDNVTILVEPAFYSNLHEYCKPIIEHWVYTKYYQICSDLNTVLQKKEEEIFPTVQVSINVPMLAEDSDRKPFTYISMDALNFLFNQYLDDGEYYLACKDELTPHQIEFYRRMYVYMHRISTEAL